MANSPGTLELQAATLAACDSNLATLIDQLPAFEPLPIRDPYLALLESVVFQQLSMKAAGAIWQRFLAFHDHQPVPARLLRSSDEQLRSVGLSRAKVKYVRAVAEYAQTSPITVEKLGELPNQVIVKQLCEISGVGRWTAEMLLMFALAREDVFAVDDLVIRQAMCQLYGIEGKGANLRKQLESIAEAWVPHRTLACRYLWAWREGGGIT